MTSSIRAYRLAASSGGRKTPSRPRRWQLQTAIYTMHAFAGTMTFESWILPIVARKAYRRLHRHNSWATAISLADLGPMLDSDGHLTPMDELVGSDRGEAADARAQRAS